MKKFSETIGEGFSTGFNGIQVFLVLYALAFVVELILFIFVRNASGSLLAQPDSMLPVWSWAVFGYAALTFAVGGFVIGVVSDIALTRKYSRKAKASRQFIETVNKEEKMTPEMKILTEKAKRGDVEAQFALGREYALGERKDFEQAVFWLNKAGEKEVSPLLNLIGIYMGACGPEHKSADGVMETFIKIVEVHGDLSAMVNLGTILVGSPANRHIDANQGGLPELVKYRNPEQGFRLIEMGVDIADKAPGGNPLGYRHYFDIYEAYHFETNKPYKRQYITDGKCYFDFTGNQFESLVARAKKIIYHDRALEALKAGNDTQHIKDVAFVSDLTKKEREMENDMLSSIMRDALRDNKELVDVTQKLTDILRQTGQIRGWRVAGKDEVADLIEKHLHM